MEHYLYQCLLEYTPYLYVCNGIVTAVGKTFSDYLGYQQDELIGMEEMGMLDLLFGKRSPFLVDRKQVPSLLFTKEGKTVFFDVLFCEHVDSQTRLYIFRKKDSLMKQELNTIHQLISNSPFGMAVFSVPDIVLLNANQTWLNRLDDPYKKKEVSIGKHIGEIMTGWRGSVFESVWNTVLRSKKACHMPEYRYSGLKKGLSYWNVSLTPIFEEGKLAYFVEITYDVTETVMNREKIKMQKEQLFKQFQQFETIVENMSDALFIIYPDSSVISLNKEAHSIRHLFNNFENTNDLSQDIQYYDAQDNEIPYNGLPFFNILNGEQVQAFRITVKESSGIHHFSISGRPVFDNQRNIFFCIVCIRDDTAQVNRDNYILKVQKEKKEYLERVITLKDDFVTLISHEFKTPLTVIGTAIQAMELFCGKELSDRANKYIATIKQNYLRQLRLVSNLLDITRGTADQIRLHKRTIDIISLTRMITDSVKIYAAQKNLKITFETNVDVKPVNIDDEKYERVILNILSNAIKFTPKGKNIQVKLFIEEKFINIWIRDEGVGIPEEKVNVIFERFGQVDNSFSRQAEGSGIGLYLVKTFVERMGGTISVKSTPYQGTTFMIKIPDAQAEENASDHCTELDNNNIVHMMNIEFSDIYLSK